MDQEVETLTVEELVAVYVKIRSTIERKKEEHEAELATLQEPFDAVSEALLAHCNETGSDMIRTPAGTVSRRVQERYWTNDWDRMYEFILENRVPQLLERRVHTANTKQFLEENPDLLPLGLQADRKFVISVRKPNAKG